MKSFERYYLCAALIFYISAFADGNSRDTIQLHYSSGNPVVEVWIDNKGPFPFIFDTGNTGIVIDLKLAAELGLQTIGVETVSSPGNPAGFEMPVFGISSLRIGQTQLSLSEATGLDFSFMQRTENRPKGIIGPWDIQDGLVSINNCEGILIIESSAELSPDSPGVQELVRQNSFPYPQFEITIAGQSGQAHIDTGSTAGTTLPLEWARKLSFSTPLEIAGTAHMVGGGKTIWRAKLTGNVQILGVVLENPILHFIDGLPSINVGSSILSSGILTIDLTNDLIRFTSVKMNVGEGVLNCDVAERK